MAFYWVWAHGTKFLFQLIFYCGKYKRKHGNGNQAQFYKFYSLHLPRGTKSEGTEVAKNRKVNEKFQSIKV